MIKHLLFLGIFLIFSGCHHPRKVHFRPDMQSLKQTFYRYWKARMHGDYKTSWRYELPSQRYIYTFKQYEDLFSDESVKNVTLKKISFIHPFVVIIDREVVYKNGLQSLKKDKWIFVDGKWFHKFFQNALPPSKASEWIYQ